ncbi:MAG: ParM/StbA family protein [Cetobacterium sp.]|nr:ParM/StbA family protein [Cetobacterium sp.]
MANLGIDYGAVNCKSSVTGIVIPSKTSKVESLTGDNEIITIDGDSRVIGKGSYERDKDLKFKQSHFEHLFFSTIIHSTDDIENNIILGLPVDQYKTYKKEYKEFIKKISNKVFTIARKGQEEEQRRIVINNVDILPEGLGVLYSLTDEQMNELEGHDILIIDIGGSTTDWVLLRGTGLERSIIKHDSIPVGMHHLYNLVRGSIKRLTGDRISQETAEEIVEGRQKHSVYGEETDLGFIMDDKVNTVIEIMGDVKQEIGREFKSAKMVVCGGGSKHFYDLCKTIQPNAIKVDKINANAIGFGKVCEIKYGTNK